MLCVSGEETPRIGRRFDYIQAWLSQRFDYHERVEQDMAVFLVEMRERLESLEQGMQDDDGECSGESGHDFQKRLEEVEEIIKAARRVARDASLQAEAVEDSSAKVIDRMCACGRSGRGDDKIRKGHKRQERQNAQHKRPRAHQRPAQPKADCSRAGLPPCPSGCPAKQGWPPPRDSAPSRRISSTQLAALRLRQFDTPR